MDQAREANVNLRSRRVEWKARRAPDHSTLPSLPYSVRVRFYWYRNSHHDRSENPWSDRWVGRTRYPLFCNERARRAAGSPSQCGLAKRRVGTCFAARRVGDFGLDFRFSCPAEPYDVRLFDTDSTLNSNKYRL